MSGPFLPGAPRILLAHPTPTPLPAEYLPLLIIFPAGLTCSSVSLPQATGVPGPHILVAVLPGLPTAAELFVLPYQDPAGEHKRSAEDLEQVSLPGDISASPRGRSHSPMGI